MNTLVQVDITSIDTQKDLIIRLEGGKELVIPAGSITSVITYKDLNFVTSPAGIIYVSNFLVSLEMRIFRNTEMLQEISLPKKPYTMLWNGSDCYLPYILLPTPSGNKWFILESGEVVEVKESEVARHVKDYGFVKATDFNQLVKLKKEDTED